MNAEQKRIVSDLHKGVTAQPANRLVHNKAGDILTLINLVWEETKRADVAEAKLAAVEKSAEKAEKPAAAPARS